jgi:hypothetical protein
MTGPSNRMDGPSGRQQEGEGFSEKRRREVQNHLTGNRKKYRPT